MQECLFLVLLSKFVLDLIHEVALLLAAGLTLVFVSRCSASCVLGGVILHLIYSRCQLDELDESSLDWFHSPVGWPSALETP